MVLTGDDKERLSNRILYLLSLCPADGMTIMEMRRELAQTKDELSKDQIALLLENLTNYVHTKTVREGSGPRANEAHVWELRIYGPDTPQDKELKRRIERGSRNQ